MAAGAHARMVNRSGSNTKRRTRLRGRGGSVVTLARRVNRAIRRDYLGVYSRAGIAPLPVRVIASGGTYRRPKPAGEAVST